MASCTGDQYLRKTRKPLVEKKRRDRINRCLAELKTLLLQNKKFSRAQSSKLDKADILELTVNYLRQSNKEAVTTSVDDDAHTTLAGDYKKYSKDNTVLVGSTSYNGSDITQSPETRLPGLPEAGIKRDTNKLNSPLCIQIPWCPSDFNYSNSSTYSPLLVPVYENRFLSNSVCDDSYSSEQDSFNNMSGNTSQDSFGHGSTSADDSWSSGSSNNKPWRPW